MSISSFKTPVSKLPAKERICSFREVCLGYSEEEAVKEASRCLECKRPLCVDGCPVNIDIPAFIRHIKNKDFSGALSKIKEKNGLPGVCGRVCPQEDQCEQKCILGRKHEPVAIGRLERAAADFGPENGKNRNRIPGRRGTGKKVAVIGSGPGGLTAACDLAGYGHSVTLFEALHKPGGVLVYGIPEFRLPKAIVDSEVGYIKGMGVELRTNFVIGKTLTVDDLFKEGYQAVFIAIGAGLPKFQQIAGENLNGVYSANEYLTRSNLMKSYLFPKYHTPIKKAAGVAVIGGGNVAMDSARTALRLGASEVTVVYRRSLKEMPARKEEIENAEEEGIIFHFLSKPVRIIGESGWVKGMECIHMELGEPDESGRRRPVPVKGSEFSLKTDIVIVAIGTSANPLLPSTTPDMGLNKWGYIVTDGNGRTDKKGVWAGGDIVTGSATVIQAMGSARKSSADINKYLTEG